MLSDDPGGYYHAGYSDGSGKRKFNPPSDEARKDDSELNPFDEKIAIRIYCPDCGAFDWVEWKFLGHLKHDLCGYRWYVGSGEYSLMQLSAAFGAGKRFAKNLTSSVSSNQEGAWIAKALGWVIGTLVGLAVRLEFGLLMIPIQAIAGLCQPRKTAGEIVSRSIVIAVFVVAVGVLIYEVRQGAGVIPITSNVTASASPAAQGGATSPVQNGGKQSTESLRRMILGKWYPTNTVPRAIRAGLDFKNTGERLTVPYRWIDGSDRPDSSPMKGKWSIENRTLNFDGDSPWPIVRITKDQLVLEGGAGDPIIFSRTPASLKRF